MAKYRCKVCGQIFEVADGVEAQCPVCKVKGDKLELITPEDENKTLVWPAEHVLGVAEGVDKWIYESLCSQFNGECSEVGMYLAMARQAKREGYPEVGMVLENIAWEEAEHAARFQEMTKNLLSNSLEENIKKMLAGENGACHGKLEIAKKAKELNLDAIHDSVHEMARDEARHGKELIALLDHYFKK